MSTTTDVAIVGGGAIGCSIAYYLSKEGINSTVFEQSRFASGASGATAGLVTPLWHVNHANNPLFALGLRSLESFPKLAAELSESGIDPEFRQSGVMKVAFSEEEEEVLKRDLGWQGELGLGVRWLERAEILDREPELSSEVLGGVYSPREGHVTGQRMVDSLVHAASARGATFLEGVEVTGLETDGRRVVGVRTRNGTVLADQTVLAAGPWTGLAGRWVPQHLPIRPVKGQRLLLRKAEFLPRSALLSFAGTIVPLVDGTILVGATRHEGEFDQEITADAIMTIMENAVSLLPTLRDARFVGAQAGVRPGSPDDVPIIGPVPGWEGLSVASGHDAVGIMLSPGTGQLIAEFIRSGDAAPLKPFLLSRFDDTALG